MKKLLVDVQDMFINIKSNQRMKYLRQYRNLTIKQAAEKCITTEKCWSDWENGKAIPRKRNKKIIALVLNVNEEIIFGNPKTYAF